MKQMQQTVLKEHNLDLAIKSSKNLLSNSNLDPMHSTSSTQSFTPSTTSALNLDSTSTFNISADSIEPNVKFTEVIEPTVIEPTVATKPTVVAPTNTILEEKEATLDWLLNCAYEKDLIPNRVLDLLARGVNYSKDLTIADCSIVNKKLHYRGLLYVPDYHVLYLCLCKLHHDTPVAGHLGIENTYELLHQSYY